MSCIELPDFLCPLTEGYKNKLINNIKESEQDDGFKKRRAINTALKENISISYYLKREKITEFKQWYKTILNGGSNSVMVYDIVIDDLIRVRLLSTEMEFKAKNDSLDDFVIELNFERLV